MFPFNDFREFLQQADELGFVKKVEHANCESEIGALSDMLGNSRSAPLLLFEKIKNYPPNFRVASNCTISPKLSGLVLGLDPRRSALELIKGYKEKIASLKPIPPQLVSDGPLNENVMEGDAVDMLKFPTPKWHLHDGGRYIGTCDLAITKDSEDGWTNVATYRMAIHDRTTLGIWFAIPRRHGRLMAQKYWDKGKPCPIAVSFGHDPTIWFAALRNLPYGTSEYDYAGGMRGQPVKVVQGKLTGLPIPATSEIALEGEIPPPQEEMRMEGPFCEYPGYYAHHAPELVIRVKRVMFRNDPIIVGAPMPRPPYGADGLSHLAADIWEHLERSCIPAIRGVWVHCTSYLVVISLKQLFAGQATQALLAASSLIGGGMPRYVVAVDDDIDPSNLSEVLWAITTRSDPETSINIVKGTTTIGLDPRIPPGKRSSGDMSMSIGLINACKPFDWLGQYPISETVDPKVAEEVRGKWSQLFASQT